jgi:hypothetical protein
LTTALKIVGTPIVTVTRSCSISRRNCSGSNLRSITCRAPSIVIDCGLPQPLAWYIGTTCMNTSRSHKPTVIAEE